MSSHETCCFYMKGTKVIDALVAMGRPHVDFIMSRCAPTNLPICLRHGLESAGRSLLQAMGLGLRNPSQLYTSGLQSGIAWVL